MALVRRGMELDHAGLAQGHDLGARAPATRRPRRQPPPDPPSAVRPLTSSISEPADVGESVVQRRAWRRTPRRSAADLGRRVEREALRRPRAAGRRVVVVGVGGDHGEEAVRVGVRRVGVARRQLLARRATAVGRARSSSAPPEPMNSSQPLYVSASGVLGSLRPAPAGSSACACAGSTPSSARASASSAATSSAAAPPVISWSPGCAGPTSGRPASRRRRRPRRRPRPRRPAAGPTSAAGRAGQRGASGLDLAQHVGGPLRVAVAQRRVVVRRRRRRRRARRRGRAATAAGTGARPRARRAGPGSSRRHGPLGRRSSVGQARRRPSAAVLVRRVVRPPARSRRHRRNVTASAGDGADQRGHRQRPHQRVEARRLAARAAPARRSCASMSAMISSSLGLALVDQRRSMRLRMFTDAVFRDSNTLSPSQTGQATRWAIASARSSGVLGPSSRSRRRRGRRRRRTPAAPTPATASAPAHPTLLPQQLQLAAEAVGGDPGDDPAADDPVRDR